jgi:hypothetical protein
VWYRPIAGESMNCEPPTAVNASTSTTTASGASSVTASGNDVSHGRTLNHAGAIPVMPWITYTEG